MTGDAAALRKARAAFDARRYGEAAALYETLVEACPDDTEVLLLSARASLLDGRYEEALLRSIRATYRVSGEDAAFEMWADSAAALGDEHQAVTAWRTLVDRRPDNAEARQGLARALRRARRQAARTSGRAADRGRLAAARDGDRLESGQ